MHEFQLFLYVHALKVARLFCRAADTGGDSLRNYFQLGDATIDGLDATLVPTTGTPVPGGLTFWHVVQTIETAFEHCDIVSADVNEIVPQKDTPLTQFTSAMIATKIIAAKIKRG